MRGLWRLFAPVAGLVGAALLVASARGALAWAGAPVQVAVAGGAADFALSGVHYAIGPTPLAISSVGFQFSPGEPGDFTLWFTGGSGRTYADYSAAGVVDSCSETQPPAGGGPSAWTCAVSEPVLPLTALNVSVPGSAAPVPPLTPIPPVTSGCTGPCGSGILICTAPQSCQPPCGADCLPSPCSGPSCPSQPPTCTGTSCVSPPPTCTGTSCVSRPPGCTVTSCVSPPPGCTGPSCGSVPLCTGRACRLPRTGAAWPLPLLGATLLLGGLALLAYRPRRRRSGSDGPPGDSAAPSP